MSEEPVRHGYSHALYGALSPTDRWAPAIPFSVVAALAIIGGGLVAAAIAYAPTQHTVWMVAYLVLVVGVAQFALGIGQALLAAGKPPVGLLASQCSIFNIGNAGVIAGTMLNLFPLVVAGGLLLVLALALFLYGVHNARGHSALYAYKAILVLICMSAIAGIFLAAVQ